MTVSEHRFAYTREQLDKAMMEYHELRDALQADDPDDNPYIVLAGTSLVLRNLATAAAAHARTMEAWMDDIYFHDLASGHE